MQDGLVARGRQLVAIIDPHIKRTPSLHVYKEAQDLGILCKTPDGGEYEGWCWTGSSSWVDWFDPKRSGFNHPSRCLLTEDCCSWDWWTGLFKFDKFKVGDIVRERLCAYIKSGLDSQPLGVERHERSRSDRHCIERY